MCEWILYISISHDDASNLRRQATMLMELSRARNHRRSLSESECQLIEMTLFSLMQCAVVAHVNNMNRSAIQPIVPTPAIPTTSIKKYAPRAVEQDRVQEFQKGRSLTCSIISHLPLSYQSASVRSSLQPQLI